MLQVETGGDELAVATILFGTLSHWSTKGIRDFLQAQLEKSIDSQIVDSVFAFLTPHDTKGRRSEETKKPLIAES